MDPWTLLLETARKWNLPMTQEKMEQFQTFAGLIIETNKVMNLTSITDEPGIVEKHFLDSLSAVHAVNFENNSMLLDIGTGAGFPGIPLKIMFPHLKVVLLDSLAKRVSFLNRVIDELMLTETTALHGRAEDYGRSRQYREQFDLVTSRAVAKLSVLSEYCLPFVKTGGLFFAYKAGGSSDEAAQAKTAIEKLGGKPGKEVMLTFGPSELTRVFYLTEKVRPTPGIYPRKAGTPEKKPLA